MNPYAISRIPILPFGMVNAHLLQAADGCILVDAGLPGSEHRFATALAKRGLSFADVRLIVITHAHVDHAGGAARLRELTNAPIVAHKGDLPFYNRQQTMTFCPTGPFARLFLRTGFIYKPYEAFTPDIMLTGKEGIDLAPYGIEGRIVSTAGHTPGSISVETAAGDAMVGDLIASGILLGGIARTKRAKRPPFEEDPHAVGLELKRMTEQGLARFYMGHGGPLEADEVDRHARALLSGHSSMYR